MEGTMTGNIGKSLDLGALLQGRFAAVVAAFNDQDLDSISQILDSDVMLTSLNPPTTYYGQTQVLEFLNNKFGQTKKPILQPLTTNVDVAKGKVFGTALWTDHDTPNAHITYEFTFVLRDGNTPQWYVINLWGSP